MGKQVQCAYGGQSSMIWVPCRQPMKLVSPEPWDAKITECLLVKAICSRMGIPSNMPETTVIPGSLPCNSLISPCVGKKRVLLRWTTRMDMESIESSTLSAWSPQRRFHPATHCRTIGLGGKLSLNLGHEARGSPGSTRKGKSSINLGTTACPPAPWGKTHSGRTLGWNSTSAGTSATSRARQRYCQKW